MMKLNNIGFFLLAVYLILQGISLLIDAIVIPTSVFAIFALLAGIFILIGR